MPRRVAWSGAFLLLGAVELAHASPLTALWAAPGDPVRRHPIAWAAESAQFFIAQGAALAILAWLQTMPEFAVEAVLAWKQQTPLLLANLTGALRLLTGVGWPMIYATAAFFHRRRHQRPMGRLRLEREHCVEIVALLAPVLYMFVVWYKGSLSLWDGAALTLCYAIYLAILQRFPPQDDAGIEALDRVPRFVVQSRPALRNLLIFALFAGGGALIYFMAEPFLGGLLAVSAVLGVPSFVFVQWVAPFVSEFPEKVSAFYWARTVDRASTALMNMVSSNINQWTLLPAMLIVIYSLSCGHATTIRFDSRQELELLLTLGQSLLGVVLLADMELAWWEATLLFVLWLFQFALSPFEPGPGVFRTIAARAHWIATAAYFGWCGVATLQLLGKRRLPPAFRLFAQAWRERVVGLSD